MEDYKLRDLRSSHTLVKVDNILAKAAALWITLNSDGTPTSSKSHSPILTHSQTSRLLTSALSLGVPVPHSTQSQCIRVV
jgi:hypothetical protein